MSYFVITRENWSPMAGYSKFLFFNQASREAARLPFDGMQSGYAPDLFKSRAAAIKAAENNNLEGITVRRVGPALLKSCSIRIRWQLNRSIKNI